ncbi:MAG TPA: aldo/keto reductase [Verrucomicrobiae bacterium]|nr:aldo/keto reductase [Verrucomicrobiae bacterium]
MIYRAFGKTGWRVSQIGVGCWQFGGAITVDGKPDGWPDVSDEESAATIQRAVELGINFFDTSDMYGWGRSEEVLGRAIKEVGGRDRLHIATKVGFWYDDQGKRTFNESKAYILRACDASLRQLQTDRVELYQCHLWRTERWAEFLDAFETLQKQGKIRFYGVSTNDFDIIERFDERKQLTSVQSKYSLLNRNVEREILPYCRARGIAFIARTPLAQGRLSGRMTKEQKFDADDIRNNWMEGPERKNFERDIDTVERLKPIAKKYGLTMPQLAMKFVVTNPLVATTIPGAKNRGQLEQYVAGGLLSPFTQDELAAVEQTLAQPSP